MNKVKERSLTPEALRFRYASDKLFNYSKIIKVTIYLLAMLSVIISTIQSIRSTSTEDTSAQVSFVATIVSFSITIISDLINQFLSNVKEHAILEKQLYECEITGSSFSKIEYDREMTNELNELAIRKGQSKINNPGKKIPYEDVPEQISDDYSYLYLTRVEAAKSNYLLSRMYIIYIVLLVIIAIAIVSLAILEKTTIQYLQLIIGFYPLLAPIIKNITSCNKTSTNCVKICADIDNFFADGDDSYERLARFYYYVQNIEFEMMVNRPVMYKAISYMFRHGVEVLVEGVTIRFENAVLELHKKSLMLANGLAIPKADELITRHDYTIEELERKSERKKQYYYNKGAKEAMKTSKAEMSIEDKRTNVKEKIKDDAEKLKEKVSQKKQEEKPLEKTSSTSKAIKPKEEKKAAPKKTAEKKTVEKKETTKKTTTKKEEPKKTTTSKKTTKK